MGSWQKERGTRLKIARFVLFRPIKERSFDLLCVLELFLRTLTVNSVSDFFFFFFSVIKGRRTHLGVVLQVVLQVGHEKVVKKGSVGTGPAGTGTVRQVSQLHQLQGRLSREDRERGTAERKVRTTGSCTVQRVSQSR